MRTCLPVSVLENVFSFVGAQYNRHKKQHICMLVAWLSSKYKLMALVLMLSIDQATKRHRHFENYGKVMISTVWIYFGWIV